MKGEYSMLEIKYDGKKRIIGMTKKPTSKREAEMSFSQWRLFSAFKVKYLLIVKNISANADARNTIRFGIFIMYHW